MAIAWLEINGQRHLLKGMHIGIGREADQAIILTDASVGRKHAQIVVGAGTHWLWDLDSRNGTFCNDVKVVAKPVALKPGDTVRFGSVTAQYLVEQSKDDGLQVTVNVAPVE